MMASGILERLIGSHPLCTSSISVSVIRSVGFSRPESPSFREVKQAVPQADASSNPFPLLAADIVLFPRPSFGLVLAAT